MIIRTGNVTATVVHADPSELDWLSDYLSFEDKNAFFKTRKVPSWKRKELATVRMLNDIAKSFPAGFVGVVAKAAAKEGITVEIQDTRTRPIEADPSPLLDWLRPHQLEAVEAAREHSRGVFHHVTGAGKTEVMIGLAELYNCRWLVLTHKLDLLYQIEDRFARRTGEAVGKIHDGFNPSRVTLTTFQTFGKLLAKRDKRVLDYLETVQGVMVDECHVVGASDFYKTMMSLKNAYYRYGFSGTPFSRTDKKSVYVWGALGQVIHEVRAQRLIDLGMLATPTIHMVRVHHGKDGGKTWDEVHEKAIVRNTHRNEVVCHVAQHVAEKGCLLFVKSVEHGKLIDRMLRERGVATEFVWGQAKIEVRRAAIQRLVHGSVDVLVCNVIFREGIDIPELKSVVIASGGKSTILALQGVGRGMRRHDSTGRVTKESFQVFDIADYGCGCTEPQKHRSCRWLEKHTRARATAYAKERYRMVTDSDTTAIVARSTGKR